MYCIFLKQKFGNSETAGKLLTEITDKEHTVTQIQSVIMIEVKLLDEKEG